MGSGDFCRFYNVTDVSFCKLCVKYESLSAEDNRLAALFGRNAVFTLKRVKI